MPTEKSSTFTEEHQEQVKRFLQALLDYQNHEKIEAEWQEGNPEPYHLVIKKTTKEDLVRIIYSRNCVGKELRKYKSYIQTAMAYLEDLKIFSSPKS